jgi:hypothetical protein
MSDFSSVGTPRRRRAVPRTIRILRTICETRSHEELCDTTYTYIYIHTYIHTYRKTDRQTGRQAGRHTYIHTYIHTTRTWGGSSGSCPLRVDTGSHPRTRCSTSHKISSCPSLPSTPATPGHPRGSAGRRKTGLPVGIERWVDEAVKPIHNDDERFLG